MTQWRNGDWLEARKSNHHYAWVRISEVASVESDPLSEHDGTIITRTYITMKGGNVVVDTEHDAQEWMQAIQCTGHTLGNLMAQFHAKDVQMCCKEMARPEGPGNKDLKHAEANAYYRAFQELQTS